MVTGNTIPRELPSWAKTLLENLNREGESPGDINDYIQYIRDAMPEKFDPAFVVLGTMDSDREEALVCDLVWSSWFLVRMVNELIGAQARGMTTAEIVETYGDVMLPVAATLTSLVNLANQRDGALKNGPTENRGAGVDGYVGEAGPEGAD